MLQGLKERAERYYAEHSAEIRPQRTHFFAPLKTAYMTNLIMKT